MAKTQLNIIMAIQQALKYGIALLDKLIRFFLAIGMGIIMFAVVFHVFGRYFIGKTHMGTMELVRYTMVWVTMIGTSAAFGSGDHVAITFFKERVPKAAWFWFNFTGNTVLCLFLVIMIIGGVEISFNNLNQTSLGLQISMFYPYLAIPVGGCIMLPYILSNLLENYIELLSKNKKEPAI